MTIYLHTRDQYNVVMYPVEKLRTLRSMADPKVQSMVSHALEMRVWDFPPVLVGESGLIDGNHRVAAAKQLGIKLIPAEVRTL